MTAAKPPRNVHELIVRNDAASRNLLDMIAERSLDKNDADRIEALYLGII